MKSDSRQLCLHVADRIKNEMEHGSYRSLEQLPSEYEMSRQLDVSRAVLKDALHVLEEDNVITRRHGVGNFVNRKPIFTAGLEELNSITDMIERTGKKAGSQYISAELVEATREYKRRFSPREVTGIAKIERVRTADQKPVLFCIDIIPEDLVPLQYIHEADSIFSLLENYAGKHIAYAVADIETISYHDRIYSFLDCNPEESLLLLKQVHYTKEDEPVLYSANYFRSDVFNFRILRRRV